MQLEEIRKELALRAPALARHFFDKLAPSLLPKDAVSGKLNSKTFNDPVWNNINLPQNAVEILETPLMQRLRYVRQLGVAHILYPGAHHSRLEHCIGCAHAAGQMFDIFNEYTETKLEPAADIRLILICAALLHDCGHAAFSHSSENILEDWFPDEWRRVRLFLGEVFHLSRCPVMGKITKLQMRCHPALRNWQVCFLYFLQVLNIKLQNWAGENFLCPRLFPPWARL